MTETAKLLNYTTTVPVARTVGQMHDLLARHGATGIMTDYVDGKPVALTFRIEGPHGPRAFRLPVDVAAVDKVLYRLWEERRISRSKASTAQAERTAWRVAHTWLGAQLALVQTAMASLEQTMLPYLVVDAGGTTLYQRYVEHDLRALEPGHETGDGS